MMQEVSLSGATMLDENSHNHNHSHGHAHQDPLAQPNSASSTTTTPSRQQQLQQQQLQKMQYLQKQQLQKQAAANGLQLHPALEMTAQVVATTTTGGHDHSHSHAHNNNNNKPCCGATPKHVVRPQLSLTIPVQQLVQQDADSILKAVWQVTRMGSYDLLQQIVTAWKTHAAEQQENASVNVDEAIRDAVDPAGHTLLHWATKRPDDVRFVEYFAGRVPVSKASSDSTKMAPLHWACTLPVQHALPMIRILLQAAAQQHEATLADLGRVPALETPDSTGCTPLLIAAQHGHVETVAYLVQKGASVTAVDHNRDSAVHWAAYKGSANVLGLLTYYKEQTAQFWTMPDVYGQMPLHLASLRGHTAVCRYILQQLAAPADGSKSSSSSNPRQVLLVLNHADKNGRTPLALARHKNKPTVAAALQAAAEQTQEKVLLASSSSPTRGSNSKDAWTARLRDGRWKRRIQTAARNLVSAHEWKIWLGLPEVDDVDESPKFPYYYVVFHVVANLMYQWTVLWPLLSVGTGLLWDWTAWHVVCLVLMGVTCYALYKVNTTSPGRLDDIHHPRIAHWRRLYEITLESYAIDPTTQDKNNEQSSKRLALCHTCHIARPPRSKHDRFTRGCIEQFDHHCPFVATTVGLYNYKWFLLFLLNMTLYFLLFWIVFIAYWIRAANHAATGSMPWASLLTGIFLGIHMPFPAGMLVYHAQLVAANLTTNEHMNRHKYDYLWRTGIKGAGVGGTTGREYYNRYDHGVWHNLLQRIFPSEGSYRLPDDSVTSPNMNNNSAAGGSSVEQASLLQHDAFRGDNVV